jgi:hypothetical protein
MSASLDSSIRRTVRRWRGGRPPAPPDLGPTNTFEALLDQRYKDLAAEVAEIKGRINGLIFVVIGGVIAELAVRLLT